MPNDRLTQLFAGLEPALKTVVLDVLTLEQQNISYKSVPRIKEQLDEIITRAAKRALAEELAEEAADDSSAMPEFANGGGSGADTAATEGEGAQ